MSTEKSLLSDKTANVELPETVRVSETSLFELRVRGPIPAVLVGGSWKMVGTCLDKASCFPARESKFDVIILNDGPMDFVNILLREVVR